MISWDQKQQEILKLPLGSKILVKGPVGCGKTALLKARYLQYIKEGFDSQCLLLLVMNRSQSLLWHNEMDEEIPGRVVRTSYFGFMQQQLQKFWPLVLARCPEIETKELTPTFLTFEVSQFLMDQAISRYREKEGFFSTVTAPSDRIAIELTGNLARAALAGIPHDQIGMRLQKGSSNLQGMDQRVYHEMGRILEHYRRMCLKKGCLDYGLTAEIYSRVLLQDPEYQKALKEQYRVVLVDNLEELTPSAAELLALLLPDLEGAMLCFCVDGGYSRFYGADPEYALEKVKDYCEIVELWDSYTCSPEIMGFAGSFGEGIRKNQVNPYDGDPRVDWEIDETLRSEMLRKVGERVCYLVKEENVPPGEIALVAPFVDPVMECTLVEHLSREGIPAVNIARRRRAKDNPFVNALITLSCLAHPQFGILPSFTDIAGTVSLVLGMDPIRSSLVADAVTHERPYMFPRIEDVHQRERIGFSNAERYEYIRDWLLEYMGGKALPIEEFFRKVFLEILISLPRAQENMMACQQVIDSASSFLKGLAPFREIENPNREFVMAVLKGSKAAESLVDVEKALEVKGVLLTTPIHYLYTSKNSRIQIWCDIRSGSWIPRDIKELSNPYVLSRSWSPEQEFSPEWEEAAMLDKLAVLVQCLLKRCRERVILASSQYNSQGYEDDGILSAFWEEALKKSKGREG